MYETVSVQKVAFSFSWAQCFKTYLPDGKEKSEVTSYFSIYWTRDASYFTIIMKYRTLELDAGH